MQINIHKSISEIGQKAWNDLNTGNVFTSYEYLYALEVSNCLGAEKAWQISHLTLSDDTGFIAALPLYLKYDSQGEYVFDYSWAQAFDNAGGNYYPKLLSASPFTPVSGSRILTSNNEARIAISEALKNICVTNNLSSAHINFLSKEEWELLGHNGYLKRIDRQFWWDNNNYNSFDDFLNALSRNRRKSIARERREINSKLEIKTITGNDLTETHMDKLYEFICDTYAKKWGNGIPYLTRQFFSEILKTLKEKIVIFFAYENEECVAGAINFWDNNILFGRQWGCNKEIDFLHFELCYYRAIEFAIENNIERVEAGTQGEHKFNRGYMPHLVYSAHFIANKSFENAIKDFLIRETSMIEENLDIIIAENSPYKAL